MIAYLTYPVVLGGGAVLGYVLLARGVAPAIVVGALGVAAMLVTALLERVQPYVPAWNRSRGDVGPDLLHLLVSNTGLGLLANVTVLAALSSHTSSSPWPSSWPLVAQVVLALLVAELVVYVLHRVLHEWPRAWPFHAIHHSAERLYWLNGFRSHPVDAFVQNVVPVIPLVLCGAGESVIALVALLGSLNAPLQHSNIAVRTGPLCYVLSVAELHRWHHAPGRAANVNYGTVTSIWDLVFGTFRRPTVGCETVGIDEPAFPKQYLPQLVVPFRWPPR